MENILVTKDKKITLYYLIYFFIFLTKIRISKSECQKTIPYLRGDECSSDICTDDELLNNICSINNSIIKTQWLNNILIFDQYNFRAGNFAINDDGDMIIEYSENNQRLFYGLKKDGSYLFNDDTSHSKIISFENSETMKRFESKNIFIYINDKQYLFSTGTSISISELYDLDNKY
jgi:hypothetical protein